MELVLVKWRDACGITSSWTPTKDLLKTTTVVVTSVGFIASEDDLEIVILPHHYHTEEEDFGCGELAIPVGCIEKIVSLVNGDDITINYTSRAA